MPYVSSGAAEIYYESHGEGPAVIFSPGGGGNHAIWWQQIPHLAKRYRVITIDYPGLGKTRVGGDEYDLLTWPDAILAVLDELQIERVTPIAQSLGGQPALSFAVKHPERIDGIILVSSIAGIRDEAIHSLMLADRTAADELPVMDRLLSPQFQTERPDMVFLFTKLSGFNAAVPGKNIVNTRKGSTDLAQVQALIDEGAQVWFIWGSGDAVRQEATYQKLGELIPDAHHVRVDGAPHTFYWEQPDRFNELVSDALAAIHTEG